MKRGAEGGYTRDRQTKYYNRPVVQGPGEGDATTAEGRRDKGKLCSTPLQACGMVSFPFNNGAISPFKCPSLFFYSFVFPPECVCKSTLNALFVASFSRLAAFFPTTVGRNEGERLQPDID